MGNGIVSHAEASPGLPTPAGSALESRTVDTADEAQRLILAGVEEMTEKDSIEPRVSDIVRRAGLSNKAFYRHFKSKDDLLLAILDANMRNLATQFEERLSPDLPPMDRVSAWVWGVLEQALDPERSAAHRPLLVHQGRLLDCLGASLWTHVGRLIGLLQDAIAEAREAGEIPESVDPVRDGEAIFHLAMGWMHGRVVGRVIPPREEAERVVAFALRGLGHNGGGAGDGRG
jgi:AcrR family transcriptional regulator